MLLQLNIKNFALIEKLSISFEKGFNILSGETGAGKSILIDAINYLIGGKFSKDFIRTGEEVTYVEGVFTIENSLIVGTLKDMGIEFEDMVIISRETYLSGKSIAKVNGRTLLISSIKAIGSALLDIHGQHQNQSLLDPAFHLTYLDFYCKDKLSAYKDNYEKNYQKLNEIEKKLTKLKGNAGERERDIDFLRFQIDEITNAKLEINEDKELESRYHILYNAEKISSVLSSAYSALHDSGDSTNSVIDSIGIILKNLRSIVNHMEKITPTVDNIEKIYYELEEVINEIRDYNEEVYYDEEEIQALNKRIYTIDLLKKKYGEEIETILKYKEELSDKLEEIENSSLLIEELYEERKVLMEKLMDGAQVIHDIRAVSAVDIEKNVKHELDYIGMNKSIFKIDIDKMDELTINGFDKVQFKISTNPGEPLKQLEKVVSGGELSRIMLALKTVFIDKDDIPTVIFDEIDTGISGRIAQSVGEKMYIVSTNHQVFCVTHLPQIACMSDSHYLVNKVTETNKTYTTIIRMNAKEKEEEIAKMIGGSEVTKLTYDHARELISMADKTKFNLKKIK